MGFRLIRIFIFCITFQSTCLSQFFDDFSDGNITENPSWSGNTSDFIVNTAFELQLNAPAAGNSSLYLPISIENQQIWELDIKMDFAPSTENRLDVYFMVDNPDIQVANGYYFKIGESGSNDALVFYRLNAGIATEIARGIDGSLGTDPAMIHIKILKDQEYFEIQTNYTGSGCNEQEIIFSDPTFGKETAQYFLIQCLYTSTRVDKFFFDNFAVFTPSIDTKGPEADKVELLNSNELVITFNETLDIGSAIDPSHYKINNEEIDALNIELGGPCMEVITIQLQSPITSGITNTFSISGIKDLSGNAMENTQFFELILIENPVHGDLIISEMLFNPFPGGSDFVEIFNMSDKFIDLTGLEIMNSYKQESKLINDDIVIPPKAYLALSEDPAQLWQQYSPSVLANIFETDLPSFNDDEGNVSIFFNGDEFDSFDYSEALHFELIKDPEGVSLEKLDLKESSSKFSNWHSAASTVNYATPGYENSQREVFGESESVIQLKNRIFSPDQDGFEDQLFLEFNLDRSGYVVDINVFDTRGYHIRNLCNNQLLSPNDIIKWDGISDEGQKAATGSYVLFVHLFNPDGEQMIQKLSCVVSSILD